MIVSKPIDLELLGRELAAAGVVVTGLALFGTEAPGESDLVTWSEPDEHGAARPTDLPPEAVPVVEAHDAGRQGRASAFEADEDAERLALVAARSAEDPAFAALAELTLKGV